MTQVIFNFANERAAQHFVDFLDGHGEQTYWDWMDCQKKEKVPFIVRRFDYGKANNGVIIVDTELVN